MKYFILQTASKCFMLHSDDGQKNASFKLRKHNFRISSAVHS